VQKAREEWWHKVKGKLKKKENMIATAIIDLSIVEKIRREVPLRTRGG
jgi:predicted amidohydrolase